MNVELQKCLTEIIERDLVNLKLVNSLERIVIAVSIYKATSERVISILPEASIAESIFGIYTSLQKTLIFFYFNAN